MSWSNSLAEILPFSYLTLATASDDYVRAAEASYPFDRRLIHPSRLTE
ncbi:MAG: hypothetical protein L3J98_17660 [Gammaproteobacteria bacterium]|nr:hypothetical protein [Gammaproteobacteria bacterium]MCF6261951.1 hypothetical protein [Gammaproteobacteria bacterium]